MTNSQYIFYFTTILPYTFLILIGLAFAVIYLSAGLILSRRNINSRLAWIFEKAGNILFGISLLTWGLFLLATIVYALIIFK